ncbi:Bbp19 family protein [Novosphingobium huizhouense]|uniref:Bbp19 family protein n=1 Tax=Novosphingobium huizhouense TaxID=2866625 RepID=UPI001CD882B5|nr:hypothetical protein [Novosphingobium huizhouense]
MSIERDIELMALEAEQRGALTRRALAALQFRRERRLRDAYAAVFFGGADRQTLTPEAAIVLADLGALAGIGKVRLSASEAELRQREGQRHVVLHLLSMLRGDGRKLARMARQIREMNDE